MCSFPYVEKWSYYPTSATSNLIKQWQLSKTTHVHANTPTQAHESIHRCNEADMHYSRCGHAALMTLQTQTHTHTQMLCTIIVKYLYRHAHRQLLPQMSGKMAKQDEKQHLTVTCTSRGFQLDQQVTAH